MNMSFHFFLLLFIVVAMPLLQTSASDIVKTESKCTKPPKQLDELIFRFKACGWVFSPPVVSGDVVFVGASCAGPPNFYALDKKSGDLLWDFRANGAMVSSPLVVDEMVFGTSRGGQVFALDKDSGSVIWRFETEGWVNADAILIDEHLFVGCGSGVFYMLDAVSGREVWREDLGLPIYNPCIAEQDTVIVSAGDTSNGLIVNYEILNGREVWRMEFEFPFNSRPTSKGDYIFLSSGSKLYKISVELRNVVDVFDLSGKVNGITVLDDDLVLVGVEMDLVLFDLERREAVWMFSTDGRIGNPTIDEGIVYVGSEDNHLYAVSLETGEELGRFRAGNGIPSRPYVSDGIVYFGSYDMHLYAVGDSETADQSGKSGTDPRKSGQ